MSLKTDFLYHQVMFFILLTITPLSLLLAVAFPILLGKPFHAIRSFILVVCFYQGLVCLYKDDIQDILLRHQQ